MVKRVVGASRYIVLAAVAGSFLAAATILFHGLARTLVLLGDAVAGPFGDRTASKALVLDAIGVVDTFLIGTVLYIVAAGLYELFIEGGVPLPPWLEIRTLDDLKARLAGVIVVGLLVAFLGLVVDWQGGTDILAPGLAIAAVTLAVGVVFRFGEGGHATE